MEAILSRPIKQHAFDMNLNGHKSHLVADALTARGVPLVFSTGYTAGDMREGYRNRLVLRKPFQFEALEEILSRLLSGKKNPRPSDRGRE